LAVSERKLTMSMIVKRLISAVVLTMVVSIALFHEMLFNSVMIFLTVIGLNEFFGMLERKGISIYKYFGIGLGMMIPLSIMLRFELTRKWELLFVVLALLFLIILQFKRRESSGAIVGISTTIFGVIYVSWFFSFLIKIRQLPDGIWLVAGVLIITKMGDIGAFLLGSVFGKTPLIPRISPKKSVEGSLGGLMFSVFASLACKPFLPLSDLHLVCLGIAVGILGQLGDLSESLIKRDCQIKDSASLIPGMGGVLDIIDSLLFTVPVYYFYIKTLFNYLDVS